MEYTDILTSKVIELDAKIVLELGVGEAFSTLALLKGLSRTEGHLFSVDAYSCKSGRNRVTESGLQDRWSFIQLDDLEFIKTWDKKVDILYIDTSHFPGHTFYELKLYSSYVKDNGFILLHDTLHTPETNEQGWDVMSGVKNFLTQESDWEFIELLPDDIGKCGLGLIYRKKP